jgi:pyruvate dehydrogenase E1 component
VTSADRLQREWIAARRAGHSNTGKAHVERLLSALPPSAGLVTVLDGHAAALCWMGSVGSGRPIVPLGVESFGQSGDIPTLYEYYGIDRDAIVDAAEQLCRFSDVPSERL